MTTKEQKKELVLMKNEEKYQRQYEKYMKNKALEDKVIILSNNFTRIIPTKILEKNKELYWGGNGVGDRWCNKKFNYTSIRILNNSKQVKPYSENDNDHIPQDVLDDFCKLNEHFIGIAGIFVHSRRENIITRPIRDDIKKYYKKLPCCVCGSNSELICDHKNDCYNDNDVLDTKLQQLEDFQSLCNHCNLQKRQIFRDETRDQKIFSAKNLPMFKFYDIEFPWEKKVFDKNDLNCKKDTWWYDPIEFMRKVKIYGDLIHSIRLINKMNKIN